MDAKLSKALEGVSFSKRSVVVRYINFLLAEIEDFKRLIRNKETVSKYRLIASIRGFNDLNIDCLSREALEFVYCHKKSFKRDLSWDELFRLCSVHGIYDTYVLVKGERPKSMDDLKGLFEFELGELEPELEEFKKKVEKTFGETKYV